MGERLENNVAALNLKILASCVVLLSRHLGLDKDCAAIYRDNSGRI